MIKEAPASPDFPVTRGAFLEPAALISRAGAKPALREGVGETTITLNVNRKKNTLSLDPRVTLLDALREHLNLTGAKKGCDHGQCGACTVLVNGARINACLSLAIMYEGHEITTIEGLASGEQLHAAQAAFLEHDGFQCGYCTPGQIMSAAALMSEPVDSSDESIRENMSGNICRCGAYPNIVAAVRYALSTAGRGRA